MKHLFFCAIVMAFVVTACGGTAAQPLPSPLPPPAASPTAALPPTLAPTFAPVASATPDPYAKYTIAYLRSRQYGGGQIQLTSAPAAFGNFTRYLISYPSDGITIAGFMDVPNGLGPFPVIIALHGWMQPLSYTTLDYTARYADALAGAGYLVLHPNMRNFPPSGSGDDLFHTGMAVDVLNLIAVVKTTGGQNGPLQYADPQRIGLWGHDLGGGVATRVLTISPDVKAAVLYSAVSGDDQKNYAATASWADSQAGVTERSVPEQEMPLISPMFFYQHVQAAVSVHQGMADPYIPVQWSKDTCLQLQEMGKTVECHFYDLEGHVFAASGDHTFMRLAVAFFDKYLRGV